MPSGKRKLDIASLVRPNILALRAYEAREIPCQAKLDANESPYGFDLALPPMATNRYPDPEGKALRQALAKPLELKPENLLLGNGSDELIQTLIMTFGGPVLFPTPTFVMYGIIAKALGEQAVGVALDEHFDLDERAMLRAIKAEQPKLVFLATPNNPTGNCYSTERILRVIEASRGMVVVDEAYQPFSSVQSFAAFIEDYPNLIVMRTLSKVGLAALRLGYMAAHPDIINEVNKARLPFNVNSYTQALALEALKKKALLATPVAAVRKERSRLAKTMASMKGITPYPSEANFILFVAPEPAQLHARLLERGVLIKNMDAVVKGCLRVTVGTREENDMFLAALKESLR